MIPKVVQVKPTNDFKVYVYFADGNIRLYDAKPIVQSGGVFSKISDPVKFEQLCTVLNDTLAWDIGGNFDETKCIDIDPVTIYDAGRKVEDPLSQSVA